MFWVNLALFAALNAYAHKMENFQKFFFFFFTRSFFIEKKASAAFITNYVTGLNKTYNIFR
jgi:hypothetical protein